MGKLFSLPSAYDQQMTICLKSSRFIIELTRYIVHIFHSLSSEISIILSENTKISTIRLETINSPIISYPTSVDTGWLWAGSKKGN
jgi:hypothetical protein